MNQLLKTILILFVAFLATNALLEMGETEKSYVTKPLQFFGGALIMSVLAGYAIHWINQKKA